MLAGPARISVSVLLLNSLLLGYEGRILPAGILTNANTVTNVTFALLCVCLLGVKAMLVGKILKLRR